MSPHELQRLENAFFDAWEPTFPARGGFVRDGAMDAERYLGRGGPKLLFILKEVNDNSGGHWQLRDYVLGPNCMGRTWNNVVRWKRLLDDWYDLPDVRLDLHWKERYAGVTRADRNTELADVAVMNLKKVPGGSRAPMKVIEETARLHEVQLKEQFRILDADMVVVCGTHPSFSPYTKGTGGLWDTRSKEAQAHRIEMAGRTRTVIWSWHPQASVNARGMCDSILRALKGLGTPVHKGES